MQEHGKDRSGTLNRRQKMTDRIADKIFEHEKLRKIRQGYHEAIGDIITRYYDEILRFCVYQLHDTDKAYDITQETFLRFIKNISHLEEKSLKGYLLTIAKNLCADYWNICGREHAAGLIQEHDNAQACAHLTAVHEDPGGRKRIDSIEYERVENNMFLSELLSKLPHEQREAVILRYYNDLKLTEIAKIQGVGLSTVKSRLRLGVERLKKYTQSK